jgi:ABC-2 type transport system ATP-binding protein
MRTRYADTPFPANPPSYLAGQEVASLFPAMPEAPSTLAARDFSKRFHTLDALSGVSLDISRGEVVALIGPNGSGKTTLLDAIAGQLAVDSGVVSHEGEAPRSRRGRELFYLPDGIRPWAAQRVGWTLEFCEALFGGTPRARATLIERLAIERHLGARLGTLSKGEHRRVMLAIALNTPQPFLLLDEPFDGLDLRQTREVMTLLRDHAHAGAGRGILVSIHQLSDAARVADRLVLLDRGVVVKAGTLDELRAAAGMPGASLEDVFLALE